MWNQPQRAMKPRHGKRRCTTAALLFVVLILTICILSIFQKNKEKPVSSFELEDGGSVLESHPTFLFMNNTDVIWQVPDSPKAVLFIAHGCNGRAANFWDKSSECPICIGLPEERLVALQALRRGYAVLTISSLRRCWSFGKEIKGVKGIINWWISKHKLEKLPIVALGASSGGYFVSALATQMKFSSITLMIAEGVFESISVPTDYPPTLFVHMPKDRERMRSIQENMKSLQKKGIPVKEIRCMEFPLTPNLLSDRIPGLNRSFSIRMFKVLQKNGFIDDKGYMKKDGRAIRWKDALKDEGLALDRYDLANHIQEELNLAFAYHEMTSLEMTSILQWFEEHMKR